MDPNACFVRIVHAADSDDRDELIEACFDLASWLQHGGFMPKLPPLISAAPDLLTACKMALDAFDYFAQLPAFESDRSDDFNEGGIGFMVVGELRAAIHKAEGGAQ